MGENDITIPVPDVTQPVTTLVEAPRQELEHVVEHEGRITRIEQEQAQHIQRVAQQIEETRQELFSAIENARTEQASLLEGKLSRLEELANKLEQQVVTVPQEALDTVNASADVAVPLVPEVEQATSEQVEQIIPKGLRLRRKQRHSKRG